MLRKYQYRRLYDYTKNSGIHIWQMQNSKEYIGAEAFRYGYTKSSGTCIDRQEQHSKEYTGTEDYTTTIKLVVLIFHNDFFDNNDEFLLSKPLRGT